MEIDSLWEYTNPALSEERFRSALIKTQGDDRLELLTQIARTYSLRSRFDDAHTLLNQVESELDTSTLRPQLRYFLERGRTFNSAGEVLKAREFFIKAWEQAQGAKETGLAVDAAHMVAITYGGSLEGITWNQKALSLARPSSDTKAKSLIPALLNNTAWDLHEMGQYSEALDLFYEAQQEWENRKTPKQIQIAKWSVARCLRSLARYQEALAILTILEREHDASNEVDGYLYEELGENFLAKGKIMESKIYFSKAYETLKNDAWFVENEGSRLDKLLSLASEEL